MEVYFQLLNHENDFTQNNGRASGGSQWEHPTTSNLSKCAGKFGQFWSVIMSQKEEQLQLFDVSIKAMVEMS